MMRILLKRLGNSGLQAAVRGGSIAEFYASFLFALPHTGSSSAVRAAAAGLEKISEGPAAEVCDLFERPSATTAP